MTHIHKHKLIPSGDKLMPMCVSYGISLCLCKIRIYLLGLFTFAKIPENNTGAVSLCFYLDTSTTVCNSKVVSKYSPGFRQAD